MTQEPAPQERGERTIQVNVRIPISVHDRLAAWGYFETGSPTPTDFARSVLLGAIDAAAEENPQIGELARLRAERRAEKEAQSE